MMMQEKILEKWKNEHRMTVEHYDRTNKALKVDNKSLKDKIVELKGLIRIEKENNQETNNKKSSSRTRDKLSKK